MPIRNASPITWKIGGLTDSRDGTNSFSGAQKRLVNLIPDPSTRGLWVCRPASQRLTNFTGTNAPANAGQLSGELVIGDILYGMVPSSLNVGKDEPFAYDLANAGFLPVAGITSANVPTSPPTTGPWIPPILCQVASRIVVTHDGFSEANLFTATTTGNTDGSPVITGNPDILGILPGMSISGTGIPAGTKVVSVDYFYLSTTGDTHTNTTVDNLATTTGVAVGTRIASDSINSATTTVAAVVSATEVTISAAAAGTATETIEFMGATITMDKAATASANGVTLTISGIPQVLGFFDVSGYANTSIGETVSGSRVVRGNPSILGVQPGMTITGTEVGVGTLAIPAGTTVVQTAFVVRQALGTTTAGSVNVEPIDISGIFFGQEVGGTGIQAGTTVVAATFGSGGTFVHLSRPATASGTVLLTFAGATITLSAAAILTRPQCNIVVAGGTAAAPLWGAGNTDMNILPSKPVGVGQMNGRAWFVCEVDGIPFSDSGFSCRRTSGTQALTTGDGLASTAIGPQQLSTALVGGIVQALIVFEGVSKLQQITGDPATNNLTMNVLPESTGTLAPLSVVPVSGGRLSFVSPLGLRFVGLDGKITEPIGVDGQGITDPFQFAAEPSRICSAYNVGVLRFTVQNGLLSALPIEQYWYDLPRQSWHGPHTFPVRLIQPWRATFVMAPIEQDASLWQSDAFATTVSGYTENGNPLSWMAETVLLPDNAAMAMNAVVESTLMCAASSTEEIQVTAFDENGALLGVALPIAPRPGNVAVRQRWIDWTRPLIFKQMSVRATGLSGESVRIGNLYLRYEILGYTLDESGASFWLLSSRSPYPILRNDAIVNLIPG